MKKFFAIIILTALIAVSITACSAGRESSDNAGAGLLPSNSSSFSNSSTEISSPILSGETISENDIETVKKTYSDEDRTVYATKIIDLDFNGTNELLVLTQQANPKVFEVWAKSDGKMNSVYSFGAGKVDFIDKISLKESEVNSEKVYLFSFMYDEGNNMKADEVLSMIRKTADGYEVEHLLSRGTITYPDVAEPFTKEFYRKGWSKYDIGLEQDYGDITKEEYDRLYEEYIG
ncbi:MAG: hypothetical protein HDR72_03200 [Ruminococcaceae bacterium]|nr:hypothetical protein [Oscillospiraceae bacterium]